MGEVEEGEGEEEEADASIYSLPLHVSKTSFSCSTSAYLLDDFFHVITWHHLYE